MREVILYKRYFDEFFDKQRRKVQEKIYWTINLIKQLRKIPDVYLKRIEDQKGLYEIRVQHAGDAFRIFCFFDDGNMIILLNGFQKKSQKTPRNEIEKALKIRREYYAEKK